MVGQYGANTGCRRIVDANDGKVYYIVATVHHNLENVEHSTFDLHITDGTEAWHVLGTLPAFVT